MGITEKDVEHVARLARLEITPEEKKKFTGQLAKILGHAAQLNELNTTKIQPTAHAVPMANVMREDKVVTWPDKESLLRQAPDRSGDFFVVPRILE
jgi:aspartyl-tRNA(Asn)/glutamyl-tRNA(Gln) amidotransferase subunit C